MNIATETTHQPTVIRKTSQVLTRRREETVAVRVQYSIETQNGCRIFRLGHIEDAA